jgi:hypothetical protein
MSNSLIDLIFLSILQPVAPPVGGPPTYTTWPRP